MQAYDLCRENSELALALPLEPWVLNTTLQVFLYERPKWKELETYQWVRDLLSF